MSNDILLSNHMVSRLYDEASKHPYSYDELSKATSFILMTLKVESDKNVVGLDQLETQSFDYLIEAVALAGMNAISVMEATELVLSRPRPKPVLQ